MNVLAAPFLYTLPSEIEAFYCFSRFIEECCPLYVSPTLKGVHDGLAVSLDSSTSVPRRHQAHLRDLSLALVRSFWTSA
jgi:cell cycle arrest protein BUB2